MTLRCLSLPGQISSLKSLFPSVIRKTLPTTLLSEQSLHLAAWKETFPWALGIPYSGGQFSLTCHFPLGQRWCRCPPYSSLSLLNCCPFLALPHWVLWHSCHQPAAPYRPPGCSPPLSSWSLPHISWRCQHQVYCLSCVLLLLFLVISVSTQMIQFHGFSIPLSLYSSVSGLLPFPFSHHPPRLAADLVIYNNCIPSLILVSNISFVYFQLMLVPQLKKFFYSTRYLVHVTPDPDGDRGLSDEIWPGGLDILKSLR